MKYNPTHLNLRVSNSIISMAVEQVVQLVQLGEMPGI